MNRLGPDKDRTAPDQQAVPMARLLASLQLERVYGDGRYRAPASGGCGRRMFGGHLLAQAIVAAGHTVTGGRVRAVQTTFLRPGDRTVPTTLCVDRLFDGRSHRVRQVTTQQQGQTIGSTVVSFHTRTGGDAPVDPRLVPSHSVGQPRERLSPWSDQGGDLTACPVELRQAVPRPGHGQPDRARNEIVHDYRSHWLRAAGDMSPTGPFRLDHVRHTALLAYASDLTPLESALAGAGLDPLGEHAPVTTVNHSLWFHHNPDPDAHRWTFCEQRCTQVGDGRALVHGSLTDAAGGLVATFAQELVLYADSSAAQNARKPAA